jgi:hypothetical protein
MTTGVVAAAGVSWKAFSVQVTAWLFLTVKLVKMSCVVLLDIVSDLILGLGGCLWTKVVNFELNWHLSQINQLLISFDFVNGAVVESAQWYWRLLDPQSIYFSILLVYVGLSFSILQQNLAFVLNNLAVNLIDHFRNGFVFYILLCHKVERIAEL